jgi:CrcB protein
VTLILVLLGGAGGAVARFLTDRAIQARVDAVLPWGTLTVNVLGSLLFGLLAAAGRAVHPDLGLLLGTGFCGALTTYSTFGFETVQLLGARAHWYALINVAANVVGGLAAATLGWWAGAEVLP